MTAIPDRPVPIKGMPISRAPRYLLSYLDCVDGAIATGATRTEGGVVVRWALYRDQVMVGEVAVRRNGVPL